MPDRQTPAHVIDDWVDTTEHTAGILAALADEGYVVAPTTDFDYICERAAVMQEQRNRVVRALALLRQTTSPPDRYANRGSAKAYQKWLEAMRVFQEPWVQAVLDE